MKIILEKKVKAGGALVSFTDVPALQVSDRSITIPLKKASSLTRRQWDRLIRKAVRTAKEHHLVELNINFSAVPDSGHLGWGRELQIGRLVSNLYLANYEFRRYNTKPKEGWVDVKQVTIVGEFTAADKLVAKESLAVAAYTDGVRDLSNARGVDMTPKVLAAGAKKLAKDLPITVKVLGEKAIKAEGLHALEAVGRGSNEESQLIVMEYWGAGKAKGNPTVMVGKGITFDTGGLYVKPSGSMNSMNLDMSGGANVIGAICAAAKLGIKKNIVALIPAAENAISGNSYRPGDIIKTLSGKTVEVGHTDAEGRLVVADALTYAARYKPKQVIDVATLTGAALVALGERTSALFANDDGLAEQLLLAGKTSGDEVWRMPLWPEYDADMKGDHSDLNNIHNKNSMYGGCITAAAFLHQFAQDYTWAHIDMAPRMAANGEDNLAVGATGEPMRLLVEWLKQ